MNTQLTAQELDFLDYTKNAQLTVEEMDYLDYFKLVKNPFPIAPDDDIFYISPYIEQILTEIVHGIVARKGFMVLTGDTGLGKTTISRRVLRILTEKKVRTSLVFQTACQEEELLNEINRDFGIEASSRNLGDQMQALNDFLLTQNREDRNCAIIIDDAQNLNFRSLELVRMISNFESNQQKLVQILLIGQPELTEQLNQPRLRQLRSRVIIWKQARPLTRSELKNYLLFKLNMSGDSGRIIVHPTAFSKIHRITGGNLRHINILMDRCLYLAFLWNTNKIGRSLIGKAFADMSEQMPSKKTARRWPAAVAAMGAFLVVGTAVFYTLPIVDFLTGGPQPATEDDFVRPASIEMPAIDEVTPLRPPAAAELTAVARPAAVKPPPTVPVSSPVSAFLEAYQLGNYSKEFAEALRRDNVTFFADSVYRQTGFQLVRLPRIPQHLQQEYTILAYSPRKGQPERFYLFWQPRLQVDRFYYAYKGEKIVRLQEMLAEAGFYQHQVDGIVGRYLMKALIAFQQKMELPTTGYPDNETLFMICHTKGMKPV